MTRTWNLETIQKIGEQVEVKGWVHARRDMGKVIFIDLRDKTGLLQVVFTPNPVVEVRHRAKGASVAKPVELSLPGKDVGGAYEFAKTLRSEYVVSVTGIVQKRTDKTVNTKIPTGTVEILATDLKILNESKTPPFEIDKDTSPVNEEVRLKYRYLDLRSERLHHNITLRSEFVQKAREYLFKNGFVEIETPYLTKSTPEGSRDFIVPSRLQPGKFFALPQSPQQYKQLLMAAGFERYFQIARCFRDEDSRADRGFEHSQIDIEMSFVEREDVMAMIEGMMTYAVEILGYAIKTKPFPRISYKDAMEKYGADKFDMRTPEEKERKVLAYAWVIDFPFFEKTDEGGWTFTHNPFSNPLPQYLDDHLNGRNIEKILTSQYDLVCNGYESGGGSIRAHNPKVLRATYKTMGYTDEEIEDSVGHMLAAFEFGTPPHGGIGLGIERNIMNLTKEEYIREVQAFPTTSSGHTAVMDAPGPLSSKQLKEAHIKVVE